jgi:signal transduction histidine kinase
LNLRYKIVVAIAVLVLALGLGGTLHARLTLSNISQDELEKRAVAVANDVASHAPEPLLTNDIYGLYQHISAVLATNTDIRYIVVLDSQGDVKASTFSNGLPKGLRDANQASSGQLSSVKTLNTSEGSMVDVAMPILGGDAGTVRLGISKEPSESQVAQLTFNLLALTGGVLVAGLVVAYVLATLFTRPLARLADAARAVGRGELSQQVTIETRDEVGKLATAFNTMTQQLREKEEDRTRLLEEVISAQEEERKRIARELHDEAGQALSSLMLGLKHLEETCGDPSAKGKAAELRSLAADTLDLTHDLALELRPSVLDDLGLVAALERYVKDYASRYDVHLDFHAAAEDKRLPPQEEIALYRIVQEALTNVARHAGARNVSVLLEERDGTTVVIVEDDGKGFDVEAVMGGAAHSRRLGLRGMEERAALIGGKLTIESRPGAGTAVFVELPKAVDGHGNDPDPHR